MITLKQWFLCITMCSLFALSCDASNNSKYRRLSLDLDDVFSKPNSCDGSSNSRYRRFSVDFDESYDKFGSEGVTTSSGLPSPSASCRITTPNGDIQLTFFPDSVDADDDDDENTPLIPSSVQKTTALPALTSGNTDDDDGDEDTEEDSETSSVHSEVTMVLNRPPLKPNRFDGIFINFRPILPQAQEIKIVLTIDGGGSRGIIPLFFINELLRRLSLETGQLLDRLPVDMYAGTSVGALIATAASIGKTNEMEHRYGSLVKKIFSCSWWKWPFTKFFYGYKYASDGREKAIKEFITPNIEEEMQGDLVIPFCSAKTHDILIYKSYDRDKKFTTYDASMASSAAPSFFQPHIFTGLDNESYEGTDGGLFANHPGDIALDEARARYPQAKIIMISLGTGHCNAAGNTTKKRSLLGWAGNIADLCLSLQSKQTNEGLINLSESNVHGQYFQYIRINPMIDRVDCITDGTSKEFLDHLETIARQSINKGGSEQKNFEEVLGIFKNRIQQPAVSLPTQSRSSLHSHHQSVASLLTQSVAALQPLQYVATAAAQPSSFPAVAPQFVAPLAFHAEPPIEQVAAISSSSSPQSEEVAVGSPSANHDATDQLRIDETD